MPPSGSAGPPPEPRRTKHQARDPGDRHRGESRDGRLGGARREDELEEWDWVAPPLLEMAHRAVPTPDQQAGTLRAQERDRRPGGRISTAPDDAGEDEAQTGQLGRRPRCVDEPPGARSAPELCPGRWPAAPGRTRILLHGLTLPDRRSRWCGTRRRWASVAGRGRARPTATHDAGAPGGRWARGNSNRDRVASPREVSSPGIDPLHHRRHRLVSCEVHRLQCPSLPTGATGGTSGPCRRRRPR